MLPNAHFAAVYAKPAGRPLIDTFVTEVSQDTWIYFPWDMGLAYQAPIREGFGGLNESTMRQHQGGRPWRSSISRGRARPCSGLSSTPATSSAATRRRSRIRSASRSPTGASSSAALVLGRKLAGLTRAREHVGVLLPNVQGLAVTLFGLNAFGRVPAFLNFTAGLKNLKAACELAADRGPSSPPAASSSRASSTMCRSASARAARIVWLEDVRSDLTSFDKLRGLVR